MTSRIQLDLSLDEAKLLQTFIARHYHRDANRDNRKILGNVTVRIYREILVKASQLIENPNNGDLA